MLPKIFKPKKEYELIRIGKNNDGGYLLEKDSFNKSKALVSFGLAFDWSFEKDFFNIKNCEVHCYDHTIKASKIRKYSRRSFLDLFKIKNWFKKNFIKHFLEKLLLYKDYKNFFVNNVFHYQSAIGIGTNLTNFETVISRVKNFPIFLKIDIEGSEYRILDEIIKSQNKISGIAIEFHDIDLHRDKIIEFTKNIKLDLVHIHSQNPGGKDYTDKNGDPIIVEMIFSNSKRIIGAYPKIPHPLDQLADPRFNEIKLNFEN